MPTVWPFRAVQFAQFESAGAGAGPPADLSSLVAPPYDVLDAAGKAALLARSPHNIVAVDLPHVPPKELGPPGAYEGAAALYRRWLDEGVLARRTRPGMWVYRATFTFHGRRHARTGMACALPVWPMGPRTGGGILPHEETFSGPKEDRLALMRATRAQLSPIFGLHADERGIAAALLAALAARRAPGATATTMDGTLHECWTIDADEDVAAYRDALADQDVFIADGHHRYTTQINYLRELEARGRVGEDHPARRSLFVLVSMSDPGMVIGPTHRVLGGMSGYSWDAFAKAAAGMLTIVPAVGGLDDLELALREVSERVGRGAIGLYDYATRSTHIATPRDPDPLAPRFPTRVPAWRTLDVALVQHLLVEELAQPVLNAGRPVRWAFPHSIAEVLEIGAGRQTGAGGGEGFTPQLAVIVRPTPSEAVRAVSRAGELMPQKSTFFYPKLATGLFMNPLE